jgi:hypothetical protein
MRKFIKNSTFNVPIFVLLLYYEIKHIIQQFNISYNVLIFMIFINKVMELCKLISNKTNFYYYFFQI